MKSDKGGPGMRRACVAMATLVAVCASGAEVGRFVSLDLAYAFNRDHTAAPYYDGQAAAYTWLKPGQHVVESDRGPVPFGIADPARNGGRSVFISRGQRNPFPAEVVLPVYARGVRGVHLFGLAGGWAHGRVGERVGTVTARYTDGTRREAPLRLGLEVDDWLGHTASEATVAAAAPRGGPGAGHLDAWRLECADDVDRVLAEVRLRADTQRTALSLFAVTLELAPAGGQVPDALALGRADLETEARRCRATHERLRERGFGVQADALDRTLERILAAATAEAGPDRLLRLGTARNEILAVAAEAASWANRHRFAKVPDPALATFPSAADYMAVLERLPLWAESGWRQVPGQGPEIAVFGQGGHEENSLRSLGNILFAYAFVATSPEYDPAVSGAARERLREQALGGLRYMARSHVTGDLACLDGKRWGNHWQSAWWTGKMAAAAHRLWGTLESADRALVERVVTHEADRHLGRRPPGGEFANTRSEENAWDAEVLAWAAGLFPGHEHAAAWEAKAREFMINTLSVRADQTDPRPVDGRPVREQVCTVNVHDDFTIENHGAYQFCYMACPLHSLSWCYYAYTTTGRRPPEALFHHVRDVWGVIRGTYLYDGRFAYLSGKDWARYVYGLYFIMPPLVMLQNEFGDGDARLVERERFRLFEWEQRQHGDGGLFSGRFTQNVMEGWPHEYETDGMALLALCAALHGNRPAPAATGSDEFQRAVAGTRQSPACQWLYARSPRAFTSFSWRMLEKGWTMGLFVPAGGDHMVEWGRNNLSGTFRVGGKDMPYREVRHTEQLGARCLATTGACVLGDSTPGAPQVVQTLTFVGLPDQGLALAIDRATARNHFVLEAQRPLTLHLANDLFNGNRRVVHHAAGDVALPGVGGTVRRLGIESTWLNVDQTLGLASEPGVWTLHDNVSRNAPWGSLLYELMTWNEATSPLEVAAGDSLRDAVFVLVAGDAAATGRVAASLERLSARGSSLPAFRCRSPDGAVVTVVANHSDEPVPGSRLPTGLAPADRQLPPAGQGDVLPARTAAVYVRP